jgi:hypothetical protein
MKAAKELGYTTPPQLAAKLQKPRLKLSARSSRCEKRRSVPVLMLCPAPRSVLRL